MILLSVKETQARTAERTNPSAVGLTRSRLFLVLVLALAIGVRVWRVAQAPLWWDEGNNAYFAHCTLSELVGDATRTHETNPPLHRLALALWLRIWGDGAFQLRSLSVLCSVLTVLLLYAWGSEFGGVRVGLIAALVYSLAPMAVYYGREAKGYAFCTLWVVLASYVWWRWCRREGTPFWAAAAMSLSWLLALGSHYYAALALAGQGAWVMVAQARRPRSREQWGVTLRWLVATVAALGVLSIWVVPTWRSALSGGAKPPDDGAITGLLAYGWRMARALVAGPFGPGWATWAGILPLAGLLAAACWRWGRDSQVWLWLLMASLPLAIGYGAQLVVPFQYPRFFSYVLPFVCLLAGAGFVRIGRLGDFLVVGLLVCWLSVLPLALGPRVADEEDMRPLAHAIGEVGAADTPVVVSYIWQEGILRSYLASEREYSLGWFCREDVCDLLSARLAKEQGLWLVTYDVPLQHETNTGGWWLERNAVRASITEHGLGRAVLYLPIPDETPSDCVEFDGGLTLCYTPMDVTTRAGTPVTVAMAWTRGAEVSAAAQQQTVYCHLLDVQGQVVAQADGAPQNGLAPLGGVSSAEPVSDARAVLVPADAPPGVYRLRVGVYDASSGVRLLTSGPAADGVDTGRVTVVDG